MQFLSLGMGIRMELGKQDGHEIFRTVRELCVIYKFPDASRAMPLGLFNLAMEGAPLSPELPAYDVHEDHFKNNIINMELIYDSHRLLLSHRTSFTSPVPAIVLIFPLFDITTRTL